jgi:hypothetical protein
MRSFGILGMMERYRMLHNEELCNLWYDGRLQRSLVILDMAEAYRMLRNEELCNP